MCDFKYYVLKNFCFILTANSYEIKLQLSFKK